MSAPHDEWLANKVMELLMHEVEQQHDRTVDCLTEIAEQRGTAGVHGLCYSLAHIVMFLAFGVEERGTGLASMAMFGPAGQVAPEDAPPEVRPHIWAARFVSAYANGDGGMATALFEADLDDPERHTADVAALIRMAGDVAREKASDR